MSVRRNLPFLRAPAVNLRRRLQLHELGTYWVMPTFLDWAVTDVTEFPMDEHSVAAARAFVSHALYHCDPDTVDVARLLTSELATNAVVHAHSAFDVVVSESGGMVHVEVTDGSDARPESVHAAPLDIHGRGLLLLTEFSETWGVTDRPAGKSVWFDLRCREFDSTTAPIRQVRKRHAGTSPSGQFRSQTGQGS